MYSSSERNEFYFDFADFLISQNEQQKLEDQPNIEWHTATDQSSPTYSSSTSSPASKEYSSPVMNSSVSWSSHGDESSILNKSPKSKEGTYFQLIVKTFLQLERNKLRYQEVIKYIEKQGWLSDTNYKTWTAAIKRKLSTCDIFVLNKEPPCRRPFFWNIHPACVKLLSNGDWNQQNAERILPNVNNIKKKKSNKNSNSNLKNSINSYHTQDNENQFPENCSSTNQMKVKMMNFQTKENIQPTLNLDPTNQWQNMNHNKTLVTSNTPIHPLLNYQNIYFQHQFNSNMATYQPYQANRNIVQSIPNAYYSNEYNYNVIY